MLTYRRPGGEYKDFKAHNFSVADLMRILVTILTKDDLMSRFHRTNIMGEIREDVELRSQVSHVLESNSISARGQSTFCDRKGEHSRQLPELYLKVAILIGMAVVCTRTSRCTSQSRRPSHRLRVE